MAILKYPKREENALHWYKLTERYTYYDDYSNNDVKLHILPEHGACQVAACLTESNRLQQYSVNFSTTCNVFLGEKLQVGYYYRFHFFNNIKVSKAMLPKHYI